MWPHAFFVPTTNDAPENPSNIIFAEISGSSSNEGLLFALHENGNASNVLININSRTIDFNLSLYVYKKLFSVNYDCAVFI